MKEFLQQLGEMVDEFGTAPKIEEMPRRNLSDKGINGPTAAHVIEEIHTPLNLAFVTFTTGSSAFQNIVGITYQELAARKAAAKKALQMMGVQKGQTVLFTYPPLVNVLCHSALEEYGLKWLFLRRSSRDALLASLYDHKPDVIIGESSFLRAALEDAKTMGIVSELPKGQIIVTAGTPLDLELLPIAESVLQAKVHDLYGCQEFGWLALDGLVLRDDIVLVKSLSNAKGMLYEVVVGGLPMGDSFVVADTGHVCNQEGKLITYRRSRTYPEYEVIIKATTLSSAETAGRVARSILRIKGRIVKVSSDVLTSAPHTVLELRQDGQGLGQEKIILEGPMKTKMFDDLVLAQLDYQQNSKADPVWIKRR